MIEGFYKRGLKYCTHKEAVAFYVKYLCCFRVCPNKLIKPRMKFILGSVSTIPNWNQVRQRLLLILIFTVGYAVMTAGVSGARRRSVSLSVFNTFTAIVDLSRSNFSIARAPLFQLKSAT